jgi:hypothetical protein
MSDDNLRKAEDVLHPPETLPEQFKRLVPEVQERVKQLPPEFTPDLAAAIFGAEWMFRDQGGFPPVLSVFTTEDGEFLSYLPEDLRARGEILGHMKAVLDGKPGAKAVEFSFANTSAGEGTAKGEDSLVVLYLTPACLYQMRAPITGVRDLGHWQMEVIYP